MDTTKTTTHIGLCAGYGGIELGLKRVIPNLRSVALCEIEAFACANLVAKMEAGLMEPAPIWTDLKSFPWESFRDRVDILTGGYPCQPFSAAGKRLGTEDPRHLWPYIASGIRILRPRICFFENVEGHISLGLREVIGELESMGYKVSWGIFSAREVGAPHQRKRVFILAHLKCAGLEGLHKWDASSEQTELVGADFGSSCQRSAWEDKLADTQLHGCNHAEQRPHADGVQRSLGQKHEHWKTLGDGQLWPSRPGEPQHKWEPPRVVGGSMANSNSSEQSEERRDDGEVPQIPAGEWTDECATLSGGEGEFRGEIMANSVIVGRRGRDHGDAGGLRGEIQVEGSCCSGAEAMGNAEQLLFPAAGEHGAMDEASGIPADREGSKPSQADSEPSLARKREGDGANASEFHEAQPPLGLHSDESSSFLGQALTLNPYGDNVYAYENLSKKIRAREMLFSVWREAVSQEIQWTAGGLQCFLAEKILQSRMQLDSFTQRICYFVWCIQTGHEAQGWGLRGMWVYETCGHSSQGQKPIEQLQRELGYAMCQLSYEIALEGRKDAVETEGILQGVREASERAWALSEALPEMEEVWRSSLDQAVWEKGCYVEAASIGNRTDELRLLGNGVVPATAERAFRTLLSELNT